MALNHAYHNELQDLRYLLGQVEILLAAYQSRRWDPQKAAETLFQVQVSLAAIRNHQALHRCMQLEPEALAV